MGYASYIIRRLLLTIPVIVGVTFITFFISRVIVPNPARAWAGVKASTSAVAALAARYHLSAPIYVQYYFYMEGILTGNWGLSATTGRPVLTDVSNYFPATLELTLTAIFFIIVGGILFGVLAALHHDKNEDHAIRLAYLSGFSSPPFLVALAMLLVFSYILNIFPTSGQLSSSLTPPSRITGMYIVDSMLTRNWVDLRDSVLHIILPASALALTYFGIVTRVTRSSMLEIMQRDFVKAAYAKGLSRRVVIIKHALRNALIPTTTILGLLLGGLLSGTIVIETIFSWPGIGYYATQSIVNEDFPSIMAVTLLFTVSVVFANLVADLLYAKLDPRIKV
jgi:peptide/nickel transport system permease protein